LAVRLVLDEEGLVLSASSCRVLPSLRLRHCRYLVVTREEGLVLSPREEGL